jgi:hypothetical protein
LPPQDRTLLTGLFFFFFFFFSFSFSSISLSLSSLEHWQDGDEAKLVQADDALRGPCRVAARKAQRHCRQRMLYVRGSCCCCLIFFVFAF